MRLPPSAPRPERSLAAVSAGSRAKIRSIVFGGIRQALAAAGVGEGDMVTCHSGPGNRLRLENRAGDLVDITFAWARFIEVDSPDAAPVSMTANGRSGSANGTGSPKQQADPGARPGRDGGSGYVARTRHDADCGQRKGSRGKLTPPGHAT